MLKKAGLVNVPAGIGGAHLTKELDEITLLDVYRAVDVVEESGLFQFHNHPNPDCAVGANIQSVLELILLKAQSAMEDVLADMTMQQLISTLTEKIRP